MFGSEMLELAIGLSFLFLILSLFATTVREQVETIFKTRAVHLERGIRLLLDDPNGTGITGELYRHPLIYSLFEGEHCSGTINRFFPNWFGSKASGLDADTANPPSAAINRLWRNWRDSKVSPTRAANPRKMGSNLPSYIPSRNFAMALLDMANGTTADGKLDLEAVRATAAALGNAQVGRALVVAAAEAKGDIDRARASLEAWFDGTMDRVSGWYKRESQWILLFIGLVLAAALNVDALHVAKELSSNTSLRREVVAQVEATQSSLTLANTEAKAEKVQKELDDLKSKLRGFDKVIGWSVPGKLAQADLQGRKDKVRADARLVPDGPVSSGRVEQVNRAFAALSPADRKEVRDEAANLRKDGKRHSSQVAALVDGWRSLPKVATLRWRHGLEAVPGWLVTAFAIGLGAPFWFDLLNKFMVIRSTVKPFEKSPSEGSEDRRGGRPAAAALEPVPSLAGTALAGAALGGAGPDVAPTERVTLRLAVDDYDELDPGTLSIAVNGAAVTDEDGELIELPLAVGTVQTIVIAARRGGNPVEWTEELAPSLDDEAQPLAIALS